VVVYYFLQWLQIRCLLPAILPRLMGFQFATVEGLPQDVECDNFAIICKISGQYGLTFDMLQNQQIFLEGRLALIKITCNTEKKG